MAENPDLGATIASFVDHKLRLSTQHNPTPVIVGLCGAQGIGKSTVAQLVGHRLSMLGHRTLVISLDDFYLPRSERQLLAARIHPLLATRGVPGTHDIALVLSLLDAAEAPEPLSLPRFDKATDDRVPREQWPRVESRPKVILFEGWCIGAVAQSERELIEPVNDLERLEDAHCTWRRYVNNAICGPYQDLFAKLDALILLAAPDFEIVTTWRRQQESQLRDQMELSSDLGKTMDNTEIERFVLHYERVTRNILREMPQRADLVLNLDTERKIIGITSRGAAVLNITVVFSS